MRTEKIANLYFCPVRAAGCDYNPNPAWRKKPPAPEKAAPEHPGGRVQMALRALEELQTG